VATISEAVRAARDGADYVQLGPVFATDQPRMKLLGLGSIEVAVREVTVPLLAAGGIDSSNAGQLIKVGVAGVAVRTSIMKASNPGAAAQALHSQIELALTGERSA
jgi:thiamine-phosphate pyrophosphorylase